MLCCRVVVLLLNRESHWVELPPAFDCMPLTGRLAVVAVDFEGHAAPMGAGAGLAVAVEVALEGAGTVPGVQVTPLSGAGLLFSY